MINILDTIKSLVDFVASLMSAGAQAIGTFFDFFGKLGQTFSSLGGLLPDFVQPLWIFVFSMVVVALIIKLCPFIG